MTSTDFGQEVRLTTRLHDLVRSYPRGNSIISEFIQNADDAESSSLTVTLDVCSYTGERLEDQRMVSLLDLRCSCITSQYSAIQTSRASSVS